MANPAEPRETPPLNDDNDDDEAQPDAFSPTASSAADTVAQSQTTLRSRFVPT